MKRVAVVGGGIAGLSAAYRLLRLREERGLDAEIVLLEAGGRLGGKIQTDRSAGFVVEAGPDSFLTIKPEALALARELGLGERLLPTAPDERDVYVYARGRLRRMPEGLMLMAPSRAWPFLRSDLVSWRGKLRMGAEAFLPRGGGGDESLAAFARRRLGREALETIVDPLMAGIYAGDAEELSLASTFPQFLELEKRYGSVIRGLRASGRRDRAGGMTAFASLRGGLEELVEALRARLGTAIRTNARARRIRCDDGRYAIVADGGDVAADAVIVAIGGEEAADLFAGLDEELASAMRAVPVVSTGTVSLAFKRPSLRPLPKGYGFVVPRAAGLSISAATFTSQKFPQRNYEFSVIRCFLGGTNREQLLELSDEELLARVLGDLRVVLGIDGKPDVVKIYRWYNGNPQYTVGHSVRIRRIEELLGRYPNIKLAGAYYYGVGIPDCIRSGNAAADKIVDILK